MDREIIIMIIIINTVETEYHVKRESCVRSVQRTQMNVNKSSRTTKGATQNKTQVYVTRALATYRCVLRAQQAPIKQKHGIGTRRALEVVAVAAHDNATGDAGAAFRAMCAQRGGGGVNDDVNTSQLNTAW
jgi:hypothetical protein